MSWRGRSWLQTLTAEFSMHTTRCSKAEYDAEMTGFDKSEMTATVNTSEVTLTE